MKTTIKLQSLPFSNVRTYLTALIFIAGNILLPQICHLLPQGGATWLPLYFFTLIGACLYGWRVGVLTAIFSPLINSLCFGMPPVSALPVIEMKSVVLALMAGFMSARIGKISFGLILAIVCGYQIVGSLGEWAVNGDFYTSLQDFHRGVPGMLLQIVGGWFVLKFITRK